MLQLLSPTSTPQGASTSGNSTSLEQSTALQACTFDERPIFYVNNYGISQDKLLNRIVPFEAVVFQFRLNQLCDAAEIVPSSLLGNCPTRKMGPQKDFWKQKDKLKTVPTCSNTSQVLCKRTWPISMETTCSCPTMLGSLRKVRYSHPRWARMVHDNAKRDCNKQENQITTENSGKQKTNTVYL